jgi:hypothetical protein
VNFVANIDVECQENDDGWTCEVDVEDDSGQSHHSVDVPASDYDTLTDGSVDVERLVEESFHFLLEREPRSAIMAQFDIMTIERYFPEYSNTIPDRL